MTVTNPETSQARQADSSLNLREAFAAVTGQELSADGEAYLRRIQEKLNIRSNDALWMILFSIEGYRLWVTDIPRQIAEAAALAARAQADALSEHGERIKEELQSALRENATKLQAEAFDRLAKQLQGGTVRSVTAEVVREAIEKPVRDAAARLERAASAAREAADRYDEARGGGLVHWLTLTAMAIAGGMVGAIASGFLPIP